MQTLTSMIHTVQEQVRALQEQGPQTSRTASRPPSSDPPQSPRPPRPRGQRRRGGQPGHLGQTRTLVPEEAVDAMVGRKPEPCSGCQALLSGDEAAPLRHHVRERPPLKPVITASPWHQLGCPAGGATTRGPWPDGVPRRPDGPRVRPGSRCGRGRSACRSARRARGWRRCAVCRCGWARAAHWRRPQQPRSRRQARPPARTCPRKPWRPSTRRAGATGAHGPGYGWRCPAWCRCAWGGCPGGARGPVRWWGRNFPASWCRIVPGRTPGIRDGGVRGAGRLCDAIAQRGAAVVGAPRQSGTPCWRQRTRCVRGGIGCGRARGNARLFGPT